MAAQYATWISEISSPEISLSNNDLTATAGNSEAVKNAKANGFNSGKKVWSIFIEYFDYAISIGVSTADLNYDVVAGLTIDGWVIYSRNGAMLHNNQSYGREFIFDIGDMVFIAIDVDAGKLWFGKLNGSIIDWAGDPEAGTGEAFNNIPTDGTIIHPTVSMFVAGEGITGNFGEASFPAPLPAGFEPGILLEAPPPEPLTLEEWLAIYDHIATRHYLFTLTGEADGLSDITIPISSFQSRKRSGSPSFLQVVVPGIVFLDEISARVHGDMVLKMAFKLHGKIEYIEEFARVHMKDINYSKGARQQSVTLSGRQQTTNDSPKSATLSGVTYHAISGGLRRARTAIPDIFTQPGDTVVAGDLQFTADQITTTVSISQTGTVTSSMEVSENG